LSLLVDRVRAAGLDISFSGVNESVMAVFQRTHLVEKIGEDHIYPTREKAVRTIHEHTHHASGETECPLTSVCRLA
jgi:anti-anti-sigma regulatory factor